MDVEAYLLKLNDRDFVLDEIQSLEASLEQYLNQGKDMELIETAAQLSLGKSMRLETGLILIRSILFRPVSGHFLEPKSWRDIVKVLIYRLYDVPEILREVENVDLEDKRILLLDVETVFEPLEVASPMLEGYRSNEIKFAVCISAILNDFSTILLLLLKENQASNGLIDSLFQGVDSLLGIEKSNYRVKHFTDRIISILDRLI
ncbi:hypothetical protein V6R21_09915 [Limibacter armeniacum]|uniref:hypothetical protein n=1 Tax=Limibacter armeniacum TaxID=466084 RepID=UPI002FE53AEF